MLSSHSVARWVWHSGSAAARLTRVALLPAAAAYATVARGRATAYRRGLLPRRGAGVPVIAVGNLSVGGTGKTPVAAWIASRCAHLGSRPGLVSRGYGGDEGDLHRASVPDAIVVERRDRAAAARLAATLGADVVILDDGFQRLDVARDLDIALVSVESSRAAPWPLPAGPWREPWDALRRADLTVVTRKRAAAHEARALVDRLVSSGVARERTAIAYLLIDALRGLWTNARMPPSTLNGARIVAACGIADPESFARQLASLGADVRLEAWNDHHHYTPHDARRLLSASADADYVVVTEKDAVKLRHVWPRTGRALLVATLGISWESGGEVVEKSISALLTKYYGSATVSP